MKGTSVSLTAALLGCEVCTDGVSRPQVYSGTKHAVEAMSAALRLELAPFEISVSLINPGCVHSEIFHTYKKDNVQFPTDHAQAETCKSEYAVCIVRYVSGSTYLSYLLTAI